MDVGAAPTYDARAPATDRAFAGGGGNPARALILSQIAETQAFLASTPHSFPQTPEGARNLRAVRAGRQAARQRLDSLFGQLREFDVAMSAQEISRGNLRVAERNASNAEERTSLDKAMQPEEIAAKRATTAKTIADAAKAQHDLSNELEDEDYLAEQERQRIAGDSTVYADMLGAGVIPSDERPRPVSELKKVRDARIAGEEARAKRETTAESAARAGAETTARESAKTPIEAAERERQARAAWQAYGLPTDSFVPGLSAQDVHELVKAKKGGAGGALTPSQELARARFISQRSLAAEDKVHRAFGVVDEGATLVFGRGRAIVDAKKVAALDEDSRRQYELALSRATEDAMTEVNDLLGMARGEGGGATAPKGGYPSWLLETPEAKQAWDRATPDQKKAQIAKRGQ